MIIVLSPFACSSHPVGVSLWHLDFAGGKSVGRWSKARHWEAALGDAFRYCGITPLINKMITGLRCTPPDGLHLVHSCREPSNPSGSIMLVSVRGTISLLLVSPSLKGSDKVRDWQTGKLIDMSSHHYVTHGSSTTSGRVDEGNIQANTTDTSWGHTRYSYTLDTGR